MEIRVRTVCLFMLIFIWKFKFWVLTKRKLKSNVYEVKQFCRIITIIFIKRTKNVNSLERISPSLFCNLVTCSLNDWADCWVYQFFYLIATQRLVFLMVFLKFLSSKQQHYIVIGKNTCVDNCLLHVCLYVACVFFCGMCTCLRHVRLFVAWKYSVR